MTDYHLVEFVWLPTFERTSKRLPGEEETRTREEENELRKLATDLKNEDC